MNIKGGALEFDIIANNGQINSALAETQKRVQGFTNATVEGGERMEAAYKEAAAQIEAAFKDIDTMAAIHSNAIADLEQEYARLGEAAGSAFAKGTAKGDEEFRALTQKQQAIKQEIATRKQLLSEVENTADALLKEETRLKETKQKVDQNSQAQVAFRTQLRNAREELTRMEQAGLRGTAAYSKLQQEVGRLKDAMDDANQQAMVLANDEAAYQGVISAVSGIAGAFSAAQGAIGLFADENENLQRIMVKVQSLMAITIGLQQVAQTLNKDSYFRIVTLTKAKQMFAAATLTAGKALVKFGVSAGVARVAATALMATLTLGLSVAITAIVVAFEKFRTKAQEAKKAQEEFNKAIVDTAVKPIAAINELSYAWEKLGDNLAAKKKFVEDNAEKFKELGVAVNDVCDAENLLVSNKDAFIQAQLAKAKAMAATNMAAEVAKEALENQLKLEEARKTPKVTRYVSGGQFGPGYSYEIDNPAIAKYEEKGKELDAKITKFYTMAAESEIEGAEIWKNANLEATNGYAEGTIGAYEALISHAQTQLKGIAVTDKAAYDAKIKEIADWQKQIDKITGGPKKTSGDTKTADPFLEQLEARKKKYTEYYKWVNSGDDVVRKAANTEFAGLLKEGSSYLDYLQKQRELLTKEIGSGSGTKKQSEELHKLNTAIAEETKNTVLAEFGKELQAQLNGAHSIMEMLTVLEEKRKTLTGDGSDLDNGKKQVIDDAQDQVTKKTKEQTDELIKQYDEYYSRRVGRSLEFEDKIAGIRQRAKDAETQEERDRLNVVADLYSQLYDLQIDSIEDLYQINADSIYRLGTFEQKRLQIIKDYEKLIGAARLAGQEDVARKLEGERDLEILKETQQYKEFFGDISEISIKTLENTRRTLIAIMKSAYEQGKITADQYKQLLGEINQQADNAYSGRGIEALFGNSKGGGMMNMLFGEGDLQSKIGSFKTIFSGAKGDMASMVGSSGEVAGNAGDAAGAMQGMAGGAAGALGIVDAIIKGVYDTLKAVADTLNVIAEYQDSIGNSDSADTLGDWADCINAVNETAMSGWENLKSGNVMGAISDTISMPFKLLTVLNRIHDRNIDKSIKKHAEAVRDLSNAYKQLEWQIEKALGETVYKNQKATINNMREQQAQMLEMARLEESKKKTDHDKVAQYNEQYAELGRQIEDVIASITESITQTSAKDLANELADAIAETFTEGFDNDKVASAIDKVTNKVMQNAVKNALKKQFLEQQLQAAVKGLQHDMGFDDEGGGSFDGLTPEEQQRFKDKIKSISQGYAEALKIYEDLFKDMEDAGDPTTSLSGAIKGASQESIDLLAGQTNAVRVNQVEEIEIMRQQLIHLANIDGKLGVSNRHLEQIEKNTAANASDPLRAQGITH